MDAQGLQLLAQHRTATSTESIHIPVATCLFLAAPTLGTSVFQLAHQSHCPAQNHSEEAVRKLLAGSMLPHAVGRHL